MVIDKVKDRINRFISHSGFQPWLRDQTNGEFVDVLVEFTKARDRQVLYSFWERNLTVMDRTIKHFDAANTFIKLGHLETTKS